MNSFISHLETKVIQIRDNPQGRLQIGLWIVYSNGIRRILYGLLKRDMSINFVSGLFTISCISANGRILFAKNHKIVKIVHFSQDRMLFIFFRI